mmetsp:Transcript_105817/g.183985  ORF Transcript_105817/g.183985 Transcript_105817/m.183985 type:complete len:589 (+) Transcript_105817:67-1833(+)
MGRKAKKIPVKQEAAAVGVPRTSKAEKMRKSEKAEQSQKPLKPRVIAFYSDKQGKKYREFSNFYSDTPAFRFVLPAFCRREGWPDSWPCQFSEKAIMLTKAALMGDEEAFGEIQRASSPVACKKLGRGVQNFDQKLWLEHVEEIAFEVVRQKFAADDALGAVLLSTGNAVLAEAAPNDCIWGIGLGTTDDRSLDPAQWCGRNILGFSLMRARAFLRGESLSFDEARVLADLGEASILSSMEGGDSVVLEKSTVPEDEAKAALPMEMAMAAEENFLRPVTDLEAVRSCFERYGVVGVTGVLSREECRVLVSEGLEPELPDGCHMDQPETYDLADANMNRYGVVGKKTLFSRALLEARLHPHVVAAYKAVHNREDVFACHDRYAWMRPTEMNKAWDTPFTWPGLHFDVNLRSYFGLRRAEVDEFLAGSDYGNSDGFVRENNAKHESMGRTVQGVLNVFDNAEEDGGFQCVPGFFGQALKDWVTNHPALPAAEPNGRYNLGGCGTDSRLGAQAVRVPCPAGTLILFDATLPHGTRPNTSSRNRAILFLRYLTSEELPPLAWRNRNAALRRLAAAVDFKADARQEWHMYGPE